MAVDHPSVAEPSIMASPGFMRLIAAEEKNWELAHTDQLTGLPNRLLWDELLASKENSRHPLVVFVIDVNDFKLTNDTHGHLKGDEVLKAVGEILRQSLRLEDDVPARIGGDEFGIVAGAVGLDEDQIIEMIGAIKSRILEKINGYNTDHKIKIGLSIGAAYSLHSPHRTDDVVGRADQAMYADKPSKQKSVAAPS